MNDNDNNMRIVVVITEHLFERIPKNININVYKLIINDMLLALIINNGCTW